MTLSTPSETVLKQVHSFRRRSLSLPSTFKVPKAAVAQFIRRSAIHPVPEEDVASASTMKSSTNASEESQSNPSPRAISYCAPASDVATLAQQLKYVKQMHQDDKDFYARELAHIRRLLAEAQNTIRDNESVIRGQLNKVGNACRRESAAVQERDDCLEAQRRMESELALKKKQLEYAMGLLNEAQREMIGVADDGSFLSVGSQASCSSSSSSPLPPEDSLEKFRGVPGKVGAMRRRLVEKEERFQAAYSAWTLSSKHQRRLSQVAVSEASNSFKRHGQSLNELSSENGRLSAEICSLKDRLAFSTRELDSTRRKLRSLRILPSIKDPISLQEIVQLVKRLNAHICSSAARLIELVVPKQTVAPTSSSQLAQGRSLVGERLCSRLMSSATQRSEASLTILVQAALTNWCARKILSWDLDLDRPDGSSDTLLTVYRRLRTVESPDIVAQWRALTRSQIRFSSARWSQSILTSISSVVALSNLDIPHSNAAIVSTLLEPPLSCLRSVRCAIGEQTVEPDLEIAVVPSGASFHPAFMWDALEATGSHSLAGFGDIVLSSVQLGLKQYSIGDDEEETLLPPVVLREQTFRTSSSGSCS